MDDPRNITYQILNYLKRSNIDSLENYINSNNIDINIVKNYIKDNYFYEKKLSESFFVH